MTKSSVQLLTGRLFSVTKERCGYKNHSTTKNQRTQTSATVP